MNNFRAIELCIGIGDLHNFLVRSPSWHVMLVTNKKQTNFFNMATANGGVSMIIHDFFGDNLTVTQFTITLCIIHTLYFLKWLNDLFYSQKDVGSPEWDLGKWKILTIWHIGEDICPIYNRLFSMAHLMPLFFYLFISFIHSMNQIAVGSFLWYLISRIKLYW